MKDFLFFYPTTKRKQNPGNKHTHIQEIITKSKRENDEIHTMSKDEESKPDNG